jgi:predicted membrane channel-forming protein YqfA (hemolysin III family)
MSRHTKEIIGDFLFTVGFTLLIIVLLSSLILVLNYVEYHFTPQNAWWIVGIIFGTGLVMVFIGSIIYPLEETDKDKWNEWWEMVSK